jgi:hypothetical protein
MTVYKQRPVDLKLSVTTVKAKRIFKSANELPRSKPDYVVQSPTPLGQRAVPKPVKHE